MASGVAIGELEDALRQFFSPHTSNEAKRAIERGLEQLRADPGALQVGCEVLRVSREPLALFFAASALLEASVQTRWASTGNKAVLRQFLLSQVMERGDLNKAVSNKLAKVVVDIAAMDWPEQYPEFMESVLRAATLEAPQRAKTMGLQLLLLAVEEFAGSQSGTTSIGGHGKLRLPSRRRQELRRLLRKELADIVAAIESNLRSGLAAHQAQERAQQQQQQQQQQQPAFEALHLAFEALQQLMAALPLKECVSAETVGLLFRFVAVRRSPYAVQALTCVNEILDKNFFPKELGDYVINVAMSALATLEALVGNPAAALSEIRQCAEGFPSQYTRLLCVFLRQFLRKVENSPQFPLERFMALLETYTLSQPDPEEFLHALEAWHVCASRVADDAEQSSSPTQQQQQQQQQQQLVQQPAAERYMPALLRMMQRLVERLLWSKSRVFLAELDDEEPAEPREDESSKSAASSSGAGAALAGLGATRRPDSELEDCLDRVAHLVAELAVLPSPSAAAGILPLLQQIGRELEVCLAVLDNATASEQQQHNSEQNERVLDAASDARWMFDLAARLSPWLAGGGPRAFAEALPVVRRVCLEWPLAWAGRSSERRLFTRGARFARLHTAALQLAAGVCGMGWLHTCGLLSGAAIRDPQAPCAHWAAALNHPAATFLGVEDEERRREADRQRLCAEVAAAAAAAPDSLETLRDFDGSAAAVVDLALRTLPLPTLLEAQQQQQQQYLAPPPEEVMVAALGLLNAVGSRATPLRFFEYASIRRLCQDLAKHAAALPLEARCVLLVSVSDALLTSFSAGGSNGPQHGEPPGQARERQRRAYAALLGQEATRVLELVGRAVAGGGHPREASRGAEACRPHLRALGELSRGAVARTTVVKEVMAPVVLPALPPAVELIGALLTPRPALGAGPSSSPAGGRGALSLGPARDALDLIVAALQAFGRQAGAQACNETISRLVEMFSAHATAQTLASAGGGGVMLLLKLLRLLAALIEEPTSAFKQLLPSILRLCFDDLPQVLAMLQQQGQGHLQGHGQSGSGAAAALPESAVDLLEVQYELLHKILRQHWGSYFFTRQLSVGSPGDGVALELAKAAANQRRHKLASEQSRHYFVRAMELLLDSFRRDGLSPDQFKKNLAIFDDLDRTHNLFMQEDFRRDMRPAFIQSLLGLLVANTHQLLEEELLVTVFGLASVDIENFYLQVLPHFVREFVRATKGVDMSDSALQELLSVLPNVTDMPSFTMRFHEFANDLRYFAAVLPGPA